jgi:hypothetical protein
VKCIVARRFCEPGGEDEALRGSRDKEVSWQKVFNRSRELSGGGMKADAVAFGIFENSNEAQVLFFGYGVFFLFNGSSGCRDAVQHFCKVVSAMEIYQAASLAGDMIRALYNGATYAPGCFIVGEEAKTVRSEVDLSYFSL